ncbi:hypothetical protein [Thalassoroseus pseudoceratinae]|uniref:hypothetical protein n=1 Tax=Thalassoroseus pseudoceratinae TaxID=2713176 RepID=UPI0014220E95|nr:hypothetical protein [Thalassoroseus pseudoceratinae]
MLHIASDILPPTRLSYTAFRIAFCETWERLTLSEQLSDDPQADESFGFLTEVPFLKAVPAWVQLDLLAETWQKHLMDGPIRASLVDESILYSACETTARLVDEQPEIAAEFLRQGPEEIDLPIDHDLATELRSLHLSLPNHGEFLMISHFEDLHPDQANQLKQDFGLDNNRLDELFHILGLWHTSPGFLENLEGLLTPKEMQRMQSHRRFN